MLDFTLRKQSFGARPIDGDHYVSFPCFPGLQNVVVSSGAKYAESGSTELPPPDR